MAESEEDLRRYLREKVAEEERAFAMTRSRSGQRRLLSLDPIVGGMTFGSPLELRAELPGLTPDPALQSQTAPPPAAPPPAPPVAVAPAPAPAIPPPLPAVVAGPAPAGGGVFARDILRAIAVFGAVIALGGGVLFAQRSPTDSNVWLIVSVALVACVGLFIAAGRLGAGDRHDPGNAPIVR